MSVDLVTFGCRLNAYESQVIRREAEAAGLADSALADTIVVNTCAVTAEATRQARQTIRKLARERPTARIVVTGCAAQVEPARFRVMPEVDRVLGNAEKLDPRAWRATRALFARGAGAPDDDAKVAVNDIMAVRQTASHLLDGFEGRARAFVQVQNGCDHRCTFCIIPFGRGNSRSVPMGEVVDQIRHLVERGYREVVLTGVDLTSYGVGLPATTRLGTLVRQILKHVPELPRLRLSSIDSIEADADLVEALASEPRLMPHLHLSLQAGDDMILKRMRRRHLRADAVRFCEVARRLRPDVALGADLIAGFPTETEDMFAATLGLVDDCGLSFLHVFPYSPRPGTPAARMPQLARATVTERARRLRQKGAEALASHLRAQVGRTVELLMEGVRIGRTPGFAEMELASPLRAGQLALARVTTSDARRLQGRPLAPMCHA